MKGFNEERNSIFIVVFSYVVLCAYIATQKIIQGKDNRLRTEISCS